MSLVNLDTETDVPTPHGPPEKGKLYFLAGCFLMYFAAFLPAQSLLTTAFEAAGFWGLFTLYISFTLSAFYATTAIKLLGVKTVLFVASCVNVAFITACVPAYMYKDTMTWLFFVVCGTSGLIGAPLWVAQGVYLTRLTQYHPEVVGTFNGTFLGIFFSASIFGNILVTVVGQIMGTLPIVPMFTVLLAIAIIAAVLFKFLPEPPVPIVSDPPIRELFRNMFSMARDKGIYLMGPYYFYLGATCTFAWGVVPRLLPGVHYVAPVAGVYGIGTLSASFICGKVFDLYGWKPLAIANLVVIAVGYLGIEIAVRQNIVWIFFFCSILFGAFEALGNTMALSVIMRTYTKNSSSAFFFYRLLSGFGNAIGFLFGYYLAYNWEMYLLAAMCGLTLLMFAFYLMFVLPAEIEASKKQFTDDSA